MLLNCEQGVCERQKGRPMQLHSRGVELMVELQDAADRADQLSPEEIRQLLLETATVLGDLLKRDIPSIRSPSR